ncbi:restriction endonuclease [Dehalococcoidia bacterium]|nr:restriction endonuclease [Dehalococcoidia bacterium]
MATVHQPVEPTENPQAISRLEQSEKATKLAAEMLAGNILDITPQLDFTTELGFVYPTAERILEVKTEEAVSILKSLAAQDILKRQFFDRLLRCPRCGSASLRPSTHCPECRSGNFARGRVFEHSSCKFIGLEDEFMTNGETNGEYGCPRCGQELRIATSDYQSLGLMCKCLDCYEVFSQPEMQWRCLKCSSLTPQDKITEVVIYSYRLNPAKRGWLEFELKPKSQLIEFLRQRGYQVKVNAEVKGRSGAAHNIDVLATRDDGIVIHDIAIGVEVAGEPVRLDKVFAFDNKAYDTGILDKVFIAVPGLTQEARQFAQRQRIKVLEVKDLETVLAGGAPEPGKEVKREAFEFKSRPQLIEYLKQLGYRLVENAEVKGRSGAIHNIDVLATRDDGIVIHDVAIGIEVAGEPVGLDKVFAFDNKAYDTGILDKVLIAVPGLTQEARQFAQRQRIRVFEVKGLEAEG